MLDNQQLQQLTGGSVYAPDGHKIGSLGQIFVDDRTDQPVWATVHTGMFGTRQSFVPLEQARLADDGLAVPYDKDMVKGAPHTDPAEGHLSEQQTGELYRYYGINYPYAPGSDRPNGDRPGTDRPGGDRPRTDRPGGEIGRPGDDRYAGLADQRPKHGADQAMIRSEERLDVGTEQVETGRVRLRKYVVTENVTSTVPVRHEEVRLEREPIAPGEAGTGTDLRLGEAEQEVTLHAERPTVAKTVVPQERVRLNVDTVTEQAEVTETLRQEHVDLEDPNNR
jgi:uncharacterized protein (TIGR02271 family)